MATQKRSGGIIKIGVPKANEQGTRRVPQAIEDIFNQPLVDRMFEDGSIPNSKLSGSGGSDLAVEVISGSSVTLDSSDYTILCDCSSNNITVNLPTVVGNSGLIYNIKKIDNTTNIVTIDPFGSQTIDDETTMIIDIQWDSVTIQCNGTNWFII